MGGADPDNRPGPSVGTVSDAPSGNVGNLVLCTVILGRDRAVTVNSLVKWGSVKQAVEDSNDTSRGPFEDRNLRAPSQPPGVEPAV